MAARTDPAGVTALRAGALERVQLPLEDWQHAHHRPTDTETRMTAVLHDLEPTTPVTSISGLSAVSAAATQAQTGDPCRFATARVAGQTGPAIVGSAYTGIGQICPDRDLVLHDLLVGAIEDCRTWSAVGESRPVADPRVVELGPPTRACARS